MPTSIRSQWKAASASWSAAGKGHSGSEPIVGHQGRAPGGPGDSRAATDRWLREEPRWYPPPCR